MLNQRSQSPMTLCCMIPSIWNVQFRTLLSNVKYIMTENNGYQGLRVVKGKWRNTKYTGYLYEMMKMF